MNIIHLRMKERKRDISALRKFCQLRALYDNITRYVSIKNLHRVARHQFLIPIQSSVRFTQRFTSFEFPDVTTKHAATGFYVIKKLKTTLKSHVILMHRVALPSFIT